MIRFNSAQANGPETVRQSIGHMAEDIATLAELQARLFQSDARESMGRIVRPLAVLAAGAALFVATIPVCLLAIAGGLVTVGVPQAPAYGLVAVASLLAAAGMAAWACRRFRELPPGFTRSREELVQNATWIKNAVKRLAGKPEHPGGDTTASTRCPNSPD